MDGEHLKMEFLQVKRQKLQTERKILMSTADQTKRLYGYSEFNGNKLLIGLIICIVAFKGLSLT